MNPAIKKLSNVQSSKLAYDNREKGMEHKVEKR